MNVADYDERLLLGGVGVASLFLLLLLLFGAGAGVLSESNGGTEGEAEAERHDDKLFHFLVISLKSRRCSRLLKYHTHRNMKGNLTGN